MEPTVPLPEDPAQPTDGHGQPLYPSGRVIHRRFFREHVIDIVDEADGMRAMYFMSRLIQSRMDLADPLRLVLPYTRHMMTALLFLTGVKAPRILMLGLGGGSMVKFILHHIPDCRLDVVEIDAAMEQTARSFFGLPEDPRLRIHQADGALFLESVATARFDLILVDAFDGLGMARSVHVRHFFLTAKKSLSASGILAINMTKSDSVIYNSSSKILKSLFGNRLLRLPVRMSRNEILLGFPGDRHQTDWTWMEKQAKTWEENTGLEYGQFVQDMRRSSAPFWSRAINLQPGFF
ncbi:MAG: fused MFS/spermidine synthase [Magnetococcales bacterium]|nr:fused MFS/spermidine synthase [Magnetococcales bacterium]